jgi:4-amino-4-deoxy-L-arabinose transferase-like glycosyltransferase
VPAAIVFFGGTGVVLEQSILGDSLFFFLVALTTYLVLRARDSRRLWWALAAGLFAGISFWVRTVGLVEVILVPAWLAFAGGRPHHVDLRRAGIAALAALAGVFFYVGIQAHFTGYWGLQRESAYNVYARVATFANCHDFTPPKGTASLCPKGPDLGPAGYQYAPNSPAVERFGIPDVAPLQANAVLQRFNIAAIEHEPLQYIEHVVHDFWAYYLNRFSGVDAGYTPASLLAGLEDPGEETAVEPAIALEYPSSVGYVRHNVDALNTYAEAWRSSP